MVVKAVHFVWTGIAWSIVIETKDSLVTNNVLRPSVLKRDSLFMGGKMATLNVRVWRLRW